MTETSSVLLADHEHRLISIDNVHLSDGFKWFLTNAHLDLKLATNNEEIIILRRTFDVVSLEHAFDNFIGSHGAQGGVDMSTSERL